MHKNLTTTYGIMLNHQIACDVTFIVGAPAEHEEVHTRMFMLISCSPVFHAMFEGPLAEKRKVELPDLGKDIFYTFLGNYHLSHEYIL